MADFGLHVLISRDRQVLADIQVQGTSLIIGSGGHCDVRLGPDLLAVEQLRLSIQDEAVWAEALSRSPLVTLAGAPFTTGVLRSGEILEVGPLLVQVAFWREQEVKRSKRIWTIPLAALLVVLSMLAIGAAISRKTTREARIPDPPKSPFLDDENAPPMSCPEATTAGAAAAGGELWREALDHRERAPFNPKNGLDAVRLMKTAASCFELSGDKDSGQEADTQAGLLQVQLEKSFHVHRVRLDHSIAQRDFALSKTEVRVLKSFMSGRDHPYAVWLDNMERWLDVTQGKR